MKPRKPIRVKVSRKKTRISGKGNKVYNRRKKVKKAFEEEPEADLDAKA